MKEVLIGAFIGMVIMMYLAIQINIGEIRDKLDSFENCTQVESTN